MSSIEIQDRLLTASSSKVESPSANGVSYPRWWRTPSPFACAVALMVGSVLAYGQFVQVERHHKTPSPSCSVGWPYPYSWINSPVSPLEAIHWRSLAGDVGWWFAMVLSVLIVAAQLLPRRRRFRPSAKILISATAAAAIQLLWTVWTSVYLTMEYEPGRAPFELALLVVDVCWLDIVVLGVISSLAIVWSRSSHLFTAVASYALIGMIVIGFDWWLYLNGLMQANDHPWIWLNLTMLNGAGVILLFGAMVWLTTVVRTIIENYRLSPAGNSQ